MTLSGDWWSEVSKISNSAFAFEINEKLEDIQTEFQHIEIFSTKGFGNLMVIDGCIMLTQRDNFIYHEMISHTALFSHPNPRRVLIIGGGDCGTLREVLKHSEVETVQQIDIDEQVTRMAEKHFPELCESNDDPRAELMFIDGVQWIKDAADASYDLIIVDSTDPVGPAEGLFSKPFFEQCMRVLDSNGMLIQQSESPLIHMDILKGMYKAMRGGGFVDTMTFFFPQCTYPSGWWSTTLACKDRPISEFREKDAEAKTFSTQYYNAAIHRAAMAAPEFFYPEIMKSLDS
ncbi:MAG: polyamine aminopropyltransferase [Gammaproteobacteria bacterium]|nr:polyamine aminopropyltransferase [Gammaproteobacteria bacterium]